MDSANVAAPAAVRLSWIPDFRAWAALLVLALRQQIHGWRLVVLATLFLLPGTLAAVVYYTTSLRHQHSSPGEVLEFAFIFNLIPHALAPLAALLCSAGIIRDDVEEQTLTYVLMRPIARTAVYAIKLLAATITSSVLTSFFAVATMLFIAGITGDTPRSGLFPYCMKIAAIFSMAQVAYCGLFPLISLFLRRALLIGVVYIIFFEGVLASFDTIARRMTVMYYFRVLVLRWLDPVSGADWNFKMVTSPRVSTCVWVLLGTGTALTIFGALIFASREFRMKTPEGE